jgi:hypothetical protein
MSRMSLVVYRKQVSPSSTLKSLDWCVEGLYGEFADFCPGEVWEPGGLRATTFWNSATVQQCNAGCLETNSTLCLECRQCLLHASCCMLLVAPVFSMGPQPFEKWARFETLAFQKWAQKALLCKEGTFQSVHGFFFGSLFQRGPYTYTHTVNTHLQLAGHTHTNKHTYHHIQ